LNRLGSVLKTFLAVTTAALVVGLAVFAWVTWAPRRTPAGQPPLATIRADSIPAFRDTFNAAEGEVRVLAMLSPT
jgi:hypothetical protein